MYRKSLIVISFLLFSFVTNAQKKDFRTWYYFELDGELFNLVDFSVSPVLRLWDNSSRLESVILKSSLSIPVTNFFRLGVRYRFQKDYVVKELTKNIHRYGIYGELRYKIQRFRMAYRAIYQNEHTSYSWSENGKVAEIQHRHKVSFKYREKGWDITPLLAAEMFFTVRPKWLSYQQKLRLTTGFQYRLTKKIEINLHYKFQQEYFENNPLTSHIISIGIEYEL